MVARLKSVFAIVLSLCIHGCGTLFGTSYEEDLENDQKILDEIIKANPVLDSIPAGHFFFPVDAKYSRITGRLDLSGLGLNDNNFSFPESIGNFRRIKSLSIVSNDFTDLPRGTGHKDWEAIVVWNNRMCNPSTETVSYLDELMAGFPGGYWRDSQRCGDSLSAAWP